MTKSRPAIGVIALGASSAVTLLLSASGAQAASCPADKMKVGVRASGEMSPKDVTDTVVGSIDLGKEIAGLDDRYLRYRKLVIKPGGIVPWHDHTDRPALIFVQEGEATEFRSDCSVGIVHRKGEIAQEMKGVMHWWKNEGAADAVLYAADVKHGQ